MKLLKIFVSLILTLVCLNGCGNKYEKYSHSFLGPFDTVTQYISYCESEEEFKKQAEYVEERFNYYDKLFDKYTYYENINNIYTINKAAGKNAVEVDKPIIDLIELCIERYNTVSNKVNIAFGSVISIWHDYRESAELNGGIGDVPSYYDLSVANKHTSIDSIHIDKDLSTVYIDDEHVSIDVGATAKGYAVELVKDELIAMGVDNFLLSGGGNVASYGERKLENSSSTYLDDCKIKYCVGLESPQSGNFTYKPGDPSEYNEAILVVQGESIVTSGDYQRFYEDINGVRYHHLIDPDTLYPAVHFRSVSIITEDSGYADFLSSAVFLMPYEEGRKFIDSLDGVEAIWLLEDGKIRMSDGLKDNEGLYIIEKDRLK